MSVDQVIRLITAVGQFIGVLVWPAVVVFFFVWFRRGLGDFLAHLGEFSFKAPGLEASARRQEVEAAVAAGAAVAAANSADGAQPQVIDPRGVADALPGPRAQRRLAGARVLWVDDRPASNTYERQALEALGIRIDVSLSTDDALTQTGLRSYDLIISDMGRPPDERAGYTLLDELRQAGNRTPYYIYATSRAPEHVREARQHGALGCTNSPQELIAEVTTALADRGPRP